MALASDVMQGGLSAGTASAINGQVNPAVAGAGTTIANATQLRSSVAIITTGATASGVLLPNGIIGDSISIYNKASGTVLIYPPTSLQQINILAAASGFSLATNGSATFTKYSSTQWFADLSA